MKQKQFKKRLQFIISLIGGNLLLAFNVAAFIIPHDFIMGGTTGIGMVLEEMLPFETATIILILNMFLLCFGGIVLGKQFFFSTIASSILYPVFLGLIQNIPGIDCFTENTLLSVIFGGILLGVSLGLVMRIGSSTGGTDVLNLVMHKWFHLPVSVCVYIVDIVILGGQALFADPQEILYGILLLLIETLVLDQVMLMGQSQIQIFAISAHHEQIRRKLLTELPAGVTMVQIETGCLGQSQQGVLCVISPRKLHEATSLIQSIDPNVFMTITKIKEVRGQGFTAERRYHYPEIQDSNNAR